MSTEERVTPDFKSLVKNLNQALGDIKVLQRSVRTLEAQIKILQNPIPESRIILSNVSATSCLPTKTLRDFAKEIVRVGEFEKCVLSNSVCPETLEVRVFKKINGKESVFSRAVSDSFVKDSFEPEKFFAKEANDFLNSLAELEEDLSE